MPRTTRRQNIVGPLLDKWAPQLRNAFLASIDLLRSDADFSRVVTHLTAGDVDGALGALSIDAGAFAQYRTAIASGYAAAGETTSASMPKRRPDGTRLIVRFDGAAPTAENWLRTHSSNAIGEIVDDQRTMARAFMARGLAEGRNPRSMALDLVGRYDKQAGKRVGGLIGLTARQEQVVDRVASDLKAATSETLNHYLGLKLRNRSFDRYVNAVLVGKSDSIPATIIQKMTDRYKDNALRLRGETIGRTEAKAALSAGQQEAFIQAVDRGSIDATEVERTWNATGDQKTRDDHLSMDGQTVGLNEPYIAPDGAELMYPGDPDAPAEDIINCRCWESININFLNRLR